MPYQDKEKQKEHQRLWVAQRRSDFFSDKQCVQCGSTENLELDHVDPNQKVSHRIWSWAKERREVEIAKCQVLCEKHHKIKTALFRLSTVVHGTRTMYNEYHCRCDMCRAENSSYRASNRAKGGK